MVEILKRTAIALGIIFFLPFQAFGQNVEALSPLMLKAPAPRFDLPARNLWLVKAATAALGDGKMACFQGKVRGSLRPFVSGKRACLGGYAPFAAMEEVKLLDRYNQQISRRDLLVERPMQSRAGLIFSLDEGVEAGVSYRFTGHERHSPLHYNQLIAVYRDLPGHVAVARLRWLLP